MGNESKQTLNNKENSAVYRIKNQLTYKLGSVIAKNSNSIFGYIILPYALFITNMQYKKELKNRKKLPPLSALPDYQEALKCKTHATYRVGEAFLKGWKYWYIGGLIWFIFKALQIKKEKINANLANANIASETKNIQKEKFSFKIFLRKILFGAFKSKYKILSKPAQWYMNYKNTIIANKNTEDIQLAPYYTAKIDKRATDKELTHTLIVSLSHEKNRNLFRYIEKYDTLFLTVNPYYVGYLIDTKNIALYMKKVILENGYNKVIFTGSSRAGTASLFFSALLADELEFVQFYVIAFGPDAQYKPKYPYHNSAYEIKLTIEEYGDNTDLMNNIDTYLNTQKTLLKDRQNLEIYCICGSMHIFDMFKAYCLSDCSYFRVFTVATESHGTMALFFCDDKTIENNLQNFVKLISPAVGGITDKDIITTRIKDGKFLKSLNDLFDDLAYNNKITSLYKDKK